MNHEMLSTDLVWSDAHPQYGVIVLLYNYFIPVKRHNSQVLETFWSDDASHIVAFHSFDEAMRYLDAVEAGTIAEYLPSETYTRYRAWEKAQFQKDTLPDDSRDSQQPD